MHEFSSNGLSRRSVLAGLAFALSAGGTQSASASAFPDHPLRLIVPYPAGGSTDIMGRLVGQQLAELLGKPVVIDNRSGAAGAIGTGEGARAAPDGYTLLAQIVTTAVINPLLQQNLAYDPDKDLQPVAMVAKLPNVLVINKDIPARNLQEFIAWARATPSASYGTGGVGSVMHLTGELLKREAKFEMMHVPYRGAAPALQDLMAGTIGAVLDNVTGLMGAINSGTVRAIGVTSDQRVPTLPDVPTLAEVGMRGFANASWFAIFTRAGVPADILARLEEATLKVASNPDVVKRFSELGAVSAPMGAEATRGFLKEEFAYWKNAIAVAGVKLD